VAQGRRYYSRGENSPLGSHGEKKRSYQGEILQMEMGKEEALRGRSRWRRQKKSENRFRHPRRGHSDEKRGRVKNDSKGNN